MFTAAIDLGSYLTCRLIPYTFIGYPIFGVGSTVIAKSGTPKKWYGMSIQVCMHLQSRDPGSYVQEVAVKTFKERRRDLWDPVGLHADSRRAARQRLLTRYLAWRPH